MFNCNYLHSTEYYINNTPPHYEEPNKYLRSANSQQQQQQGIISKIHKCRVQMGKTTAIDENDFDQTKSKVIMNGVKTHGRISDKYSLPFAEQQG